MKYRVKPEYLGHTLRDFGRLEPVDYDSVPDKYKHFFDVIKEKATKKTVVPKVEAKNTNEEVS